MTTAVASKVRVSIVARDLPLDKCPIGTSLFIKKDNRNNFDEKALSALMKHKKTGKWTFIGYVAAKKEYIPEDGLTNIELYEKLDQEKLAAGGVVVGKMEVTYPYGKVATALVVEMDLA